LVMKCRRSFIKLLRKIAASDSRHKLLPHRQWCRSTESNPRHECPNWLYKIVCARFLGYCFDIFQMLDEERKGSRDVHRQRLQADLRSVLFKLGCDTRNSAYNRILTIVAKPQQEQIAGLEVSVDAGDVNLPDEKRVLESDGLGLMQSNLQIVPFMARDQALTGLKKLRCFTGIR